MTNVIESVALETNIAQSIVPEKLSSGIEVNIMRNTEINQSDSEEDIIYSSQKPRIKKGKITFFIIN